MAVPATPEDIEASRSASVVRVSGLEYAPGGDAPGLRGVDMEIGVGEIVALAGSPSSGKSALLRIFAGQAQPTSGTVQLPARLSAGRRLMLGYAVAGQPHFDPLSGRENALFFARAAGLKGEESEIAVDRLFDALGLAERAERPVSEYSSAERRKLGLVEALAHRPALTLLDEPFVDLDQEASEALIRLLRLHAAQRGTVVVASRNLKLLPELADRIVFMHEGRVVIRGRVAELLASVGPSTRFEVELDRRAQRLEARFRSGIKVISDGDPFVFETSRGQAAVGEVVGALSAAGAVIRSVRVREANLAEVFRRVTGVEL